MEEATQDTLEQRLAALLEEIESTTTSLTGRIEDESPGLSYADLAEPRDAPKPGATPDQSEDPPIEPAATSGSAEPAAAPYETRDPLDDAVERMLQQAIEGIDPATSEQTEALDHELARLGDELLARAEEPLAPEIEPGALEASEQEPDAPDSDTGSVDAQHPALVDEPPAVETPMPPARGTRPETPPIAPERSPQSPAHKDPSTPDRAPRLPLPGHAIPRAAAKSAHAAQRVSSALATALARTRRHAPAWWAAARPHALHAMTWLSRPVADRPPMVRSAIGWIAVVTAFWGTVVLIYVVAIREPARAAPPDAQVKLAEQPLD